MKSRTSTVQAPASSTGSSVTEGLLGGAHQKFESGPFWQRIPEYAGADDGEFLSYAFQTKHSLSNLSAGATKKLLGFIRARAGDEFVADVEAGLAKAPMTVQMTPYILSLIDWDAPHACPIRRQFLPLGSTSCTDHPLVRLDSLDEKSDTKAPGLVHRYFDKALFLPQTTCPVYCRFCTRSYAIGGDTETVSKHKLDGTPKAWQQAFDYLRATPVVEDVVVSGGDSYNLNSRFIDLIADSLLAIDHIRRIRIATKGLAVNPGRILTDLKWTESVVRFVQRGRALGKQVVIHTHVNSPEEMTWVTREAMRILFAEGVVVRNQSVLLRGVNDSVERMALLVKRLSYLQIQPYYVYQHDLVRGVDDLRTTLDECLAIERGVRGVTAGFNTPQFVVDAPGGGGKRVASTFEFYDRDTGVSLFRAPSVKPGVDFLYFDPLHALTPEIAEQWLDPKWQKKFCDQAVERATPTRGGEPEAPVVRLMHL